MLDGNRGTLEITTPSDCEVRMQRVFAAPRRLVYAAHTQPEYLRQWLLGPDGWTMPVCEVDLRPGGAWRFVWRRDTGAEFEIRGTYREIVPPERVVTTECWGPQWPETVNTLLLIEKDGKTTLTNTILYPSKEARDAALKTGMKDGSTTSYERLATLLQNMA